MKYVKLSGIIDPTEYVERLPEFAGDLPAGARAFATDPDHYDFGGKRCVKDLKLDQLTFHAKGIEIRWRHNCWKHDDDLTVRYLDVRSIALDLPDATPMLNSVVLDEILPTGDGCRHEVVLHSGSLIIMCRDLSATWTEADCPDKA